MSIYPFLSTDRYLSCRCSTSDFPVSDFPVAFSNTSSVSLLRMFFNTFSYTISYRFLKCFSGAFTLYENCSTTPEKYKTGESPDVHPPCFPPVFQLFSASLAALAAMPFFRLSVSLLHSSFSASLLFLPYKIMQTIPPLLSFTIFCMVSCSFIWHSSSIIEILPRMPSSISSPMDFPKILVSHAPSSLFSPSLM